MSLFITRVELHYATERDYATLHTAMAKEKFGRTMVWNGIEYHLPTAEYHSTATNSSVVLQAAKRAVNATGKNASIVVVESAGVYQDGLVRVY